MMMQSEYNEQKISTPAEIELWTQLTIMQR